MSRMMKAAIFVEPGRIELADKPIPEVGPNDALVRITDLRMGQEPSYVFSFAVARRASPPEPIAPAQVGGRDDIDIGAALRWLWQRMWGADVDPPR